MQCLFAGIQETFGSSFTVADGICRHEPLGIDGRTSRTQVKQETKFRTHVSGRVQLNTQGLQCLRGCLTAGQCSKKEARSLIEGTSHIIWKRAN
mmetsp:Transcript_15029/g.33955  ORF Transcript_15029/g.33955 Transcript_15029/m.33955 type:complete len:94 (-) Transcript_15029:279-560(-)